MIDDGVPTNTSHDQEQLEERVLHILRDYADEGLSEEDPDLVLTRKQHAAYLLGGLGELPSGFISLDASRTWIAYWSTHALALLGSPLPLPRGDLVAFLASCQHPEGGFGGGPYQLAHLAPTYAAVAALVTLGGEEALGVIDRQRLWRFLLRMCVPPAAGGGMTMHEGGEVDVRGCYCALAVCHMVNLDKHTLAEACGMETYIRACQSYEGGLGGEPWNEAHGGYTFCGLAALALLGRTDVLDIPALLRWAANRQGWVEGGFMGRTNKLVDGCYSFWQGAAFPLIVQHLSSPGKAWRDAVLQQQQEHRLAEGQQEGDGSIPPVAAAAAAANAGEGVASALRGITQHLLSGEAEALVGGLAPLAPAPAAEAALARAQEALDDVIDRSLQADERVKEAVARHEEGGQVLQQEAAALLERAAEMQKAADHAAANLEVARCSAAALLAAATASGAVGGGGAGATAEGRALYDTTALQLWLLKCCQAPRGGMRDKPGKPPDYYHTCYCLSGLASAQHHGGSGSGGSTAVLGGEDNLLARADPLCNVLEEKLAAARAHFCALPQPRGVEI